MSAGTFAAGTEIWIHGRAAKILVATDPTEADVEFSPSGERQRLNLPTLYIEQAISWEPPQDAAAEATRHLEQITEAEWAEARRREGIIRPLLEGEDIKSRAAGIATRESVTWRTLFRWKREYLERGLRGLIPNHRARGAAGALRLDSLREEKLQAVLKDVYLLRTRPTIQHAYEQVLCAFTDDGLNPPCLHTVRDRIHAMDARRRTAARDGGKDARARHAVVRGGFPAQAHPLQTILIDHTPLDIQLVDSTDRTRVIGRPFLTLAADAMTRMIFGYYLTLEPPSYLSVAMCLLQGVLPKDDVIRRFNLQQPWPIYGLPTKVHTDNGKDFRSRYLEHFAQQYSIELLFRPVRQPWWGGQIERVIGTVNRTVHHLPGTTKSNVAARGEYDAEANATFTIEEIDEFLARRIVEKYHLEVHGTLGKSPLQAWQEATGSGRFVPALPPDVDRFRIDLLPYEERTIQREGLALFGLDYADGVLQTWRGAQPRGASAAKHIVKYDPRDLSRVFFIPPDGGPPLPIPLSDRSTGAFSMLELQRMQALAKASRETLSMRNLAAMLSRERTALAAAADKTKRAKRVSMATKN